MHGCAILSRAVITSLPRLPGFVTNCPVSRSSTWVRNMARYMQGAWLLFTFKSHAPISVAPAWSKTLAFQDSSILFLVAGIRAPGSPAQVIRLIPRAAGSIPSYLLQYQPFRARKWGWHHGCGLQLLYFENASLGIENSARYGFAPDFFTSIVTAKMQQIYCNRKE